jgi:hypothetical protein
MRNDNTVTAIMLNIIIKIIVANPSACMWGVDEYSKFASIFITAINFSILNNIPTFMHMDSYNARLSAKVLLRNILI